MRLIELRLSGFRRFHSAKVNLDEHLIALVGANEAGKSSVLDALASLNHIDAYGRGDRARGRQIADDDVLVEVRFLLEDEERKLIRDLGLEGEPRWYVLDKHANGRRVVRLEPNVRRDLRWRQEARRGLEGVLNDENLDAFLANHDDEENLSEEDEAETSSPSRAGLLLGLRELLEADEQQLPEEAVELVEQWAGRLRGWSERAERSGGRLSDLAQLLEELAECERRNPHEEWRTELRARRPRFMKFDDDHHLLSDEYGVDVLEDPPSALRNLAAVAGLDLEELQAVVEEERHPDRTSMENSANMQLKERFQEARQHTRGIYLQVQIDPDVIRVQVHSEPGKVSHFAERSDGLRWFCALFAYISLGGGTKVPPILLIDEAESHLHYDAQADLVRMLATQRQARQVIYTTHSAGCLPFDLGRGIRGVRRITDEETGLDTGTSVIDNSIWTGATAGLSPLLLAMGASALAIVPSRRAVVGEGLSDMMLWPELFREVTGDDALFQVVQGASSMTGEEATQIKQEARQVVFLLDGDTEGGRITRKLRRAGVAEDTIVLLEDGLTLEDLLDEQRYIEAVNEELRRSHGGEARLDASVFTGPRRAKRVDLRSAGQVRPSS